MINQLKKLKNRFLSIILIVILVFIIGFSNTGIHYINVAERFIGDLLTPVISVFSTSINKISSDFNTLSNIPELIDENKILREENIALKEENLDLNHIISRTPYLRSEYELLRNTKFKVESSNIIGKSNDDRDLYLIDKGSLAGIKPGDSVISGVQSSENVIVEGLVGIVREVGDNFSKISLITEENNNIAFTNIRSQDGGIINHTTGSVLEGYMYEFNSDVVADDRVYTSGLGEVYKPRIYLGKISNVTSDEDDLQKRITIVPAVNFDKLTRVFVITGETNE